jgi:hypothetical protein
VRQAASLALAIAEQLRKSIRASALCSERDKLLSSIASSLADQGMQAAAGCFTEKIGLI